MNFIKGNCLKFELYDRIRSILINAGWNNISSHANDSDVMYSKGEDGTRDLVFQIRPSNVTGSNSVITTDNCVASVRLVGGYTPASTNAVGVFERPAEVWRAFPIATTTALSTQTVIDRNTPVTYRFNANKNRLIICIEYPHAINVAPVTLYIGLPDEVYCSEPKSRGLLFLSSCIAVSSSSVLVTDNAGELASSTTSVTRSTLCQLSPRNPNSGGTYTLSEIFYGDASEGTRGKLAGLLALPTQNIQNGDIIVQGSQEYYVVVNGTASNDGFPSKALALPLNKG